MISVTRVLLPWSPPLVALILACVLLGLAYWLLQPLLLVPMLLLFALADRVGPRERILLLFDQLYIVERSGATRAIPLTAITAVEPAGPQRCRIRLPAELDQDLVIPIDFAKPLRERMAGQPILFARNTLTGDGAVPAPIRCTLCGRPEPNGLAGAGLFICETCSLRARHEAEQGGHGLGTKDPKPM